MNQHVRNICVTVLQGGLAAFYCHPQGHAVVVRLGQLPLFNIRGLVAERGATRDSVATTPPLQRATEQEQIHL